MLAPWSNIDILNNSALSPQTAPWGSVSGSWGRSGDGIKEVSYDIFAILGFIKVDAIMLPIKIPGSSMYL
jgi:hypothetical protein